MNKSYTQILTIRNKKCQFRKSLNYLTLNTRIVMIAEDLKKLKNMYTDFKLSGN